MNKLIKNHQITANCKTQPFIIESQSSKDETLSFSDDSNKDPNDSNNLHAMFLNMRMANSNTTVRIDNSNIKNEVGQQDKKEDSMSFIDMLCQKYMSISFQSNEEETPFFQFTQENIEQTKEQCKIDQQQETQASVLKKYEYQEIETLKIDNQQTLINHQGNLNYSFQSYTNQTTKDTQISFSKEPKLFPSYKRSENQLLLRQHRWKKETIKTGQKRIRTQRLRYWVGEKLECEKGLLNLKKMKQIIDFFIHQDCIDEVQQHITSIYTDYEIRGFIKIKSGKMLRLNLMNQDLKYKIFCRQNIFEEKCTQDQYTNIIIKSNLGLIENKGRKTLQLSNKEQYGFIINRSLYTCTIQIKIKI